MSKRHMPPTRRSMACVTQLNPFGPNQCGRCSGSVQARYTSSRGASNTRVRTISRSRDQVGSVSFASLTSALLCVRPYVGAVRGCVRPLREWLFALRERVRAHCSRLHLLEVRVEAIEALFPRALGVLGPLHHVVEGFTAQPTRPPLSVATALDEPRPFEHPEVARDRGQADVERLGELEHGGLTVSEPCHDRAPRGVGQRGERGIELGRAGKARVHAFSRRRRSWAPYLTFVLNTVKH